MSVTPASFRQTFPEFKDAGVYTDIQITAYTTLAGNLLDPVRWGVILDYGTSLYVAHRLALSRRDQLTQRVGGVPGEVKGPATAKSVDKVSGSFDSASVTLEDQGQWNLTRYGIEFMQLARQFGSGGMQISGACGPVQGVIPWVF